jgi:hypothetical protein
MNARIERLALAAGIFYRHRWASNSIGILSNEIAKTSIWVSIVAARLLQVSTKAPERSFLRLQREFNPMR